MEEFGGTWTKHNGVCESLPVPLNNLTNRFKQLLPALGTLIIRPEQINTRKAKKFLSERRR